MILISGIDNENSIHSRSTGRCCDCASRYPIDVRNFVKPEPLAADPRKVNIAESSGSTRDKWIEMRKMIFATEKLSFYFGVRPHWKPASRSDSVHPDQRQERPLRANEITKIPHIATRLKDVRDPAVGGEIMMTTTTNWTEWDYPAGDPNTTISSFLTGYLEFSWLHLQLNLALILNNIQSIFLIHVSADQWTIAGWSCQFRHPEIYRFHMYFHRYYFRFHLIFSIHEWFQDSSLKTLFFTVIWVSVSSSALPLFWNPDQQSRSSRRSPQPLDLWCIRQGFGYIN